MPIYEYICRACGHEFEVLVRPASTAPVCLSCQSSDLERVVSGFAVSSENIRTANVKAAKKRAAADPNRRDKRIADQEFTREHFTEHGIQLPPPAKVPK
jgi:putative FmdB family regulatory protein